MASAITNNRLAKPFIIRGYFLNTGGIVRLRKTHRARCGVSAPSQHRNENYHRPGDSVGEIRGGK